MTQGVDVSVGHDSDGARADFRKCVVAASHPTRVRCGSNPITSCKKPRESPCKRPTCTSYVLKLRPKAVKGTRPADQRGHQRAGMVGACGIRPDGYHPRAAARKPSWQVGVVGVAAVTGQPSKAEFRSLGGIAKCPFVTRFVPARWDGRVFSCPWDRKGSRKWRTSTRRRPTCPRRHSR